jgi:hypothetical protein
MSCAVGLLSLLRRGRWGAGETDLEAERMKLPHEPIGLALGVTATLEVIGAEVGEALARIFDESTGSSDSINFLSIWIYSQQATNGRGRRSSRRGRRNAKSTARFGILVGVEKC